MAQFEDRSEESRDSKFYGKLPAFTWKALKSLDGNTPNEQFADLLSLFGGKLDEVIAAAISAYNYQAKAKASGSDIRQISKGLRDALKAGAFPGHDENDVAFLNMLVETVRAKA